MGSGRRGAVAAAAERNNRMLIGASARGLPAGAY